MEKHTRGKVKGITLMALVITVIVLLILSGITIATLSGKNGIINQSLNAKDSAAVKSEMRIVEVASNSARGKNKNGIIEELKLKNELATSVGKDKTSVENCFNGSYFLITFLDTNRVYKVDNEDDFKYLGVTTDELNSGVLNANPRRDKIPKKNRTIEISIRTIRDIEDDDRIEIRYGWVKSRTEKPESLEELDTLHFNGENHKIKCDSVNTDNLTDGKWYLYVEANINDGELISDYFGDYIVGDSIEDDEDIFMIAYVLNGGTNNESNPSSYTSESEDITLLDATRTGYTFTGWTGNGTTTPTKNLVLPKGSSGQKQFTANWEANTYTIAFNKNSESATGEMANLEMTYGVEKNLTQNTFTRTGYEFGGWNTKADGTGTNYSDGQKVKNLATSGEVTLYAKWNQNARPSKPIITANYSEGNAEYTSGNWANKLVYTTITSNSTENSITAIQYSKDNKATWNNLSLGRSGGIKNTGSSYYGQENWTATNGRNDTIYFRVIDSAGNISDESNAFNIKYDTASPVITANNITFGETLSIRLQDSLSGVVAWQVSSSSTEPSTGWTTITSTADKTVTKSDLTAGTHYIWAKDEAGNVTSKEITVTYLVTYEKGTNVTSIGKTSETTTGTVTLPTITASNGYTVQGWYNENTKVGNAGGQYTVTGNVTLTAKATINTYTVEYYQGNNSTTAGSTKFSTTSSHTYGTASALKTYSELGGTPPSGWVFAGWSTAQDGTTVTYTDGQSVTNLTSTGNGTVKLYAIFKRNLVFKSGSNAGTTNATSEQRYNPYKTTGYLTSVTSPSALTSITGWTKTGTGTGYRNSATAGAATVALNAAVTPVYNETNLTYYGVYTKVINVYSGVNKGTNNSQTQYLNTNGNIVSGISLEVPATIENWTAIGYRDDTTVGDKETAVTTSAVSITPAYSTSAISYYAVYSRTLTIKYNGNSSTSGSTDSTTKTVYLNTNSTTTSSQQVTLANNGFIKNGYAFSKWAKGSTSGTKYSEGTSYTAGLAYNASSFEVIMYAIWQDVYLRTSEIDPAETTAKFLYTKIERRKIKSIIFENSIAGHTVDGTTCFDVSSITNSKQVLLWITNTDSNGYYDIVIGQNGGVRANPDSSKLFSFVGYDTPLTINFTNFNTSNVTNMSRMFSGCGTMAMTSLNLGDNFNTSNVTNMSEMFSGCGSEAMTSLDLGDNFDTSKVTNMSGMFNRCGFKTMISLDLGNKFDTSNVINMSNMFSKCGYTAMTSLDLGDNFDTSSVTDMSYMFIGCGYKAMTSLDLGDNFNTSNVTNMRAMFSECGYTAMTSLYLGDNFNTSNVINMAGMFHYCGYTAMTSLDLGNKFDTSSVTDMHQMFSMCGYIAMISLELGEKFDTSRVTDMGNMFYYCGFTAMTSLDLGEKFDTSNVTNMYAMFSRCGYTAMTSLDLGDKFDTSNVTNMSYMFDLCSKLVTIYATDSFVTTNVTNGANMFTSDTKLVGGMGTRFDRNHIDHAYAHLDLGTTNPGYFTDKRTYYVEFDANGGTGTMARQIMTYGESSNLTTNAFTKAGYTFAGWNDKADGSGTSYTDGQSVLNLENGWKKVKTLYAQWSTNTYTIAYAEMDGATHGTNHPTSGTYNAIVQISNPTKAGYTFAGWTSSSSDGLGTNAKTGTSSNPSTAWTGTATKNTYFKNLTDTNNGTVKLTATWTANTYTITLNKASGTGGTSTIYETYGSKYSLTSGGNAMTTSANPVTLPTRSGYEFQGYYTISNGAGTQYISKTGYLTSSASTTNFTANGTLYAYWTRPVYEITLDNQGATTSGTDKIYLTYNTKYSLTSNGAAMSTTANPITIPTKDGYAFMGYYNTSATTGGTQYINATGYRTSSASLTGFTANGTLYARWEEITLKKSETSTSSTTAKFLGTTIERRKIKSITFSNSIAGHTVDGTTCFDVSSITDSKQVLLWITNTDSNGYYDIVIGQNGGVKANPDSSYLFSYVGYDTPLTINLTNFDTSSVHSMVNMFEDCGYTSMTSLNLGDNFNTSSVTSMSYMFSFCGYKAMTSLNLGENFDTSSVTDMREMFSRCGYTAMTSLDLGDKFDTSNVTSMYNMFYGCGHTAMTNLDLGDKFDTSKVTNMMQMFTYCGYTAMTSLDLGDKFDTSSVTNMCYMFCDCGYTAMTSLDLGDKFDTSSVNNMAYMFDSCGKASMTSLDLGEKFDTSNVTNMSYMFRYCGNTAMTNLNLGDKFDTSNVTDMSNMFASCGYNSMTSLNLGDKFDTSSVTNMSNMFSGCGHTAMISLDLGDKFDTSNVTNMSSMFLACGHTAMTSLDLGDKFDTSKVTNMSYMFSYCGYTAMTSLDLGDKFDTSSVTNMYQMFNTCSNLVTIYATESFVTTNVTNGGSMFTGDTKLVGGMGTVFDSNHKDQAYAHLDLGTTNPGYFTDKRTYYVEFDANGGTGTMARQTMTYGESSNLTTNAFTKTGYTFAGWNTEADGSGTSYTNGQSVLNLENGWNKVKTLYAQWTVNTYTISYDYANGIAGTNAPTSGTYDTDVEISNPTRNDGYSFAGWTSSTPDGLGENATTGLEANPSTAWTGTATKNTYFKNLTDTNNGTVKLTAIWKANYKLRKVIGASNLISNGGFDNYTLVNPETKTANGVTHTWDKALNGVPGNTSKAYSITSWDEYANGTGANMNVYVPEIGYHAHMRIVNGNNVLRFKTNEAYAGQTAANVSGGVSVTPGTIDANRWLGISQQLTGTNLTAGATYVVTLDAYRVSGNQNITVGIYHATTSSNSERGFNSGTYSFNPKKIGEWETFSKTFTLSSNYVNTINPSLYVYGCWDGTGEIYVDNIRLEKVTDTSYITKAYDSLYTTEELTPATRTGYAFDGWYTDARFTKRIDETDIFNTNTAVFEDVNTPETSAYIYAKWRNNSYNIVFNKNNSSASGAMTPMAVTCGDTINLTNNNFAVTTTGVTSKQIFTGWNTKTDGSGTNYTNGASVSFTATAGQTVTLYAQWIDANYEVSSPVKYTLDINDAISKANASATIKVLKTQTDNTAANIAKNLTLNLNGKTLTRNASINITAGNFTINGSADGQTTGTLYYNNTADSSAVLNTGASSSVTIQNKTDLKSKVNGVRFGTAVANGNLNIYNSYVHSEGAYSAIRIDKANSVNISGSYIFSPYGYPATIYVDVLPTITISGKSRVGGGNLQDSSSETARGTIVFSNASQSTTTKLTLKGNAILMAGWYYKQAILANRKINVDILEEAEVYSNNGPTITLWTGGSTININTSGWVYAKGSYVVSAGPNSATVYMTRGTLVAPTQYMVYESSSGKLKSPGGTANHEFYAMNTYYSYTSEIYSNLYEYGNGFVKVGNSSTYRWTFISNGVRKVDWVSTNGGWYYFWNTNNTQQLESGDTTTYVSGYMVTKWIKINGNWFYLDSDGNKDPVSSNNGKMHTGHLYINNKHYFLAPYTGFKSYDSASQSVTYTFEKGQMVTGYVPKDDTYGGPYWYDPADGVSR